MKLELGTELMKSFQKNKYFNLSRLQKENLIASFPTKKRRSDFTYVVRKNQNVKNRKEQLPMAYCLCVPRPVGG